MVDVPALVNVPTDLLVEAGRASMAISYYAGARAYGGDSAEELDRYTAPKEAWDAVFKLLSFAHDVSAIKDSTERVRKAQRGE